MLAGSWGSAWAGRPWQGVGGKLGGRRDGGRPSSPRDYWRGQRKALRQLLWGVNPKGSVGTALVQALRQPLTHHVQKCALLLQSLGDAVGEVSGGGLGEAEAGEMPGPLWNSGTWV